MIVVRKDRGRVEISFPYSQDYIAKIKTMEGYRWHPEGKYWSVPYSELEKLLSVFDGESIVIQDLLGHKSSKTTEIYTHVSNKDLGKIKSPLDLIMKNSDIEN